MREMITQDHALPTKEAIDRLERLYYEVLVLTHPTYNGVSIYPDEEGGITMLITTTSLHKCISINVTKDGQCYEGIMTTSDSIEEFDPSSNQLAESLSWIKN